MMFQNYVNKVSKVALSDSLYLSLRLNQYRKQCSLPLDKIFEAVSIETRTDCNLRCKFCPQSTKPRPLKVMSEEIFKRVIDQLAEMKFAGRIGPLTNNEPLLDDRIINFIAYARQKCPLSFLALATNGRLLSEELLFEIFAAGLDYLIINDYRDDRLEHPFRLSANLEKIAELEKGMFRKKISISRRYTSEVLGNRAGNISGQKKVLPLKQFCALPFARLWVQSEGKVFLCCQDYNHDEIMGDVNKSSLSEIWFGDKYRRIREELYRKDRTGKICNKCDYSGVPLSI